MGRALVSPFPHWSDTCTTDCCARSVSLVLRSKSLRSCETGLTEKAVPSSLVSYSQQNDMKVFMDVTRLVLTMNCPVASSALFVYESMLTVYSTSMHDGQKSQMCAWPQNACAPCQVRPPSALHNQKRKPLPQTWPLPELWFKSMAIALIRSMWMTRASLSYMLEKPPLSEATGQMRLVCTKPPEIFEQQRDAASWSLASSVVSTYSVVDTR